MVAQTRMFDSINTPLGDNAHLFGSAREAKGTMGETLSTPDAQPTLPPVQTRTRARSAGRRLAAGFLLMAAITVLSSVLAIVTFQQSEQVVTTATSSHRMEISNLAKYSDASRNLLAIAVQIAASNQSDSITELFAALQNAEGRLLSVSYEMESNLATGANPVDAELSARKEDVTLIFRRIGAEAKLILSISDTLSSRRQRVEGLNDRISNVARELSLAASMNTASAARQSDLEYLNEALLMAVRLSATNTRATLDQLSIEMRSFLNNLRVRILDRPTFHPYGHMAATLINIVDRESGLIDSQRGVLNAERALQHRIHALLELTQSFDEQSSSIQNLLLEKFDQDTKKASDFNDRLGGVFIGLAMGSILIALGLAYVFRKVFLDIRDQEDAAQAAQQRLHQGIQSLQSGFALFDTQQRLVTANDAYWSLSEGRAGQTGAAVKPTLTNSINRMVSEALDHNRTEQHRDALVDALEGRRGNGASELHLTNGKWVLAALSTTPSGEWVLVISDITDLQTRRKEAETARHALENVNTLLQSVFTLLDQGIGVFDKDLRLQMHNKRYQTLLSLPDTLVQPETDLESIITVINPRIEMIHGGSMGTVDQHMEKFRTGSIAKRADVRLDSGATMTVKHSQLPAGGYVMSLTDVTEDRTIRARLLHHATHDPLTDLFNRGAIQSVVDSWIEPGENQTPRSFAVVLLNMDGLVSLNETFGHDRGDAVLRIMGERLRALEDQSAIARAGRFAGDTFAFLLALGDKVDDTDWIVQSINALLTDISHPVEVGAITLEVRIASGAALFPPHGDTAETLFANAEKAMVAGNADTATVPEVVVFNRTLGDAAERRATIRGFLPNAVNSGQIAVFYQPKIDLQTIRPIGAEALVRWIHPELGFISPAEFIPIAEKTGCIIELGEHILREACSQTMALSLELGLPLSIAVNISPAQVLGQDIEATVLRVLEETGLPPRQLEIEITEGLFLGHGLQIPSMLQALRDRGVKVAMDDFGTGYSSLSYLKRLPVDVLKIDQSFVRDLDHDPEDRKLVNAIISLAQDFDLKVVAEGVETEGHRAFLTSAGCALAQGYFFSKPIPGDRYTAYIRAQLSNSSVAISL